MKTYMDCWAQVSSDLFQQALSGEPELVDSLPKPFPADSFGFVATLAGDQQGRFAILVDASILEAPLLGEGADQKAGWNELLQETINAAAGEMLAKTGTKLRVEKFEPSAGESKVTRAFQLKSGTRSWTILVSDEVHPVKPTAETKSDVPSATIPASSSRSTFPSIPPSSLSPGLELLLDVELEASLDT